jgi:hypothetical protein
MAGFVVKWERAYRAVEQRHCGRVANNEQCRNRDILYKGHEQAERDYRMAVRQIKQILQEELHRIERAKAHLSGTWPNADDLRGMLHLYGLEQDADIVEAPHTCE